MGVEDEEQRLYRGAPLQWRAPHPGEPFSYVLFAATMVAAFVEMAAAALEVLLFGRVRLSTARTFAIVGILAFAVANIKSLVLPLKQHSTDTLVDGLEDLMRPLWPLHFWLNPFAVFSVGLFLLSTPRPQSPFYLVAYGVLLWQTFAGLLAREALPLPQRRGELARIARATHRQPAIFVLLVFLVIAGFVDSIFP